MNRDDCIDNNVILLHNMILQFLGYIARVQMLKFSFSILDL